MSLRVSLIVLTIMLAVAGLCLGGDAYYATQLAASPPQPAQNEAVLNVVKVAAPDGSCGSGTYLGDRLVLTAAHVVRGQRSANISFPNPEDNQGAFIDVTGGTVLARDETWDQALIELDRLPRHNPAGSPLADANPTKGEVITYAGYPSAQQLRVFSGSMTGYYSAAGQSGQTADWFEANASARSGYSGGAAYSEKGHLYGNLWGGGNGYTVAVCLGRTKRFLFPWNARLEAWRLAVLTGNAGRVYVVNGGTYCPPGGSCRIVGPGDPGYIFNPNQGGAGMVPMEPAQNGVGPTPPPSSAPTTPATPDQNIQRIEQNLAKAIESIAKLESSIGKLESRDTMPGVSYQLSDEDVSTIVGQLLVSMEGNPAFRGPKGEKGDNGKDGQSAKATAFSDEDYKRIALQVQKNLAGELRVSVQPVTKQPAKK